MQDQIEVRLPDHRISAVNASRDSEALFRILVDSVRDYAIFVLDVNGFVVTWNSGAARLKGYAAHEIIGKHFSAFYAYEDVNSRKPEQELVIAQRDGSCQDEGWRVRKDGSRFWASVVITPMLNADGQLCGYSKVTRDITERALLSDQLTAFFNLSLDFLLVAGFDGFFKRVNSTWETALGFSSEELASHRWLEFVHPDDIQSTIQAGTELVDGKNVVWFENRYRRTDGDYRWLRWNAVSYPIQQLIFAVGRDITEDKEIEEKTRLQTVRLQESERALEEAQRVAKIGNWQIDLATQKITWSKQLFALLGIDPAQGEPDLEANMALYCPEDAAKVKAAVKLAISDGVPYALDLRRAVPGQKTMWIHAIGQTIYDNAGIAIRLVGTAMDVTDRKLSEEALWETSERLQQATDSGSMGVWEYNMRSKVLTWNERMMAIYDFTPDSFPGAYEAWSVRLHPDDRERAEAELSEAMLGGQKFDTEFRLMLPSGEIRHIKANAILLKDENNVPVRMVGLNHDITVARNSEEQLRTHAAQQEAANALLRISEESLQARSQELVRSNTDLEQFAHVASHDLQEPLRMVASFMQLLEKKYKGQLDEQADRWIHHAVDGATRMQELIQDLLSYSRIESGGKEFEACEMTEVVSRAIENLRILIKESKATVTFDTMPCLIGDKPQLRSLLQNLIGNAIKYHGDHAACVHISAEREGDDWLFSVRDNGIGIAPEFADRVFVIFQRLHTRQAYPGTGIGLAICKKIVERHGGRIRVESEPGLGSIFLFNLPSS